MVETKMNALDYLYYKLYRATLVGSLKEVAKWAAVCYFCLLLFLNFMMVLSFLRKIDLIPSFPISKMEWKVLFLTFLVFGYFLFIYKNRFKKIIFRYEQEDEVKRKSGNLRVWIFLLITIVLVFTVPFFKPGKF